LTLPLPPRPSLLPYTTLFRSRARQLPHHPLPQVLAPRHALGAVRRPHQPHSHLNACIGFPVEPTEIRVTCIFLRRGSGHWVGERDRKSTRLNSSHVKISYAVF